MRLLQIDDSGEFSLVKYVGRDIPPYAILSHTWGADYEEVTFRDLVEGAGKSKAGYRKLSFCGKQAASDGLRFFWVDTCCINKENTVELSDAINSMFEWYRNATRCYVYLSDVSTTAFASNKEEKLTKYMPLQSNWTSMVGISNEEDNPSLWDSDFRKSKWFTRGWTLQELLAPSSLEFFSKEGQRLGDKSSLVGPIHSITGIPEPTLQGAPLSQISVNKRLSWMEHRETKLEEDKAYSLLGIFGVYIPPIYGEGKARAYKRLLDEIEKLEKCMQHIRLTDPRDDKKRIEDTKGGLLKDSYRWILENSEFQKWRNDQQSQLLWIKGDPGKGKTMLLCGIISELNKSMAKKHHLAYFFCQATDSRINNATAVLRGLLYFMVDQQPLLVSHVRKKYDHAGKALFEDINAWVALKEIFISILQDPSLVRTYLVIDALDECVAGLPKLLELVVLTSTMSPCVKWIVSSRNWTEIERYLGSREQSLQLSLELNATSISTAVDSYIQHKVSHIAQERQYNDEVRGAVLNHLSSNANSTFLWVALVCQLLEKIPRWKVLAKLNAFPPKLDSIYERMMQQVRCSDDVDLCKQILASIAIVYRPITLAELTSCVEMLQDMANDQESIQEIVSLCGSFLTIREDTVYFVHQSAKDFLLDKAFNDIFPFGMQEAHHKVFSRSLQVMDRTLQRDMYNLRAVGCPIEQVKRPDPDPLEASYYSCIYWVDHLCDWITSSSTEHQVSLQDGEIIDEFMRTKYLYWLEALSLSRSMSHGVVSMAKLVASIPERAGSSALAKLAEDARRFIMYHKVAMENCPLQTYASALVFTPTKSVIRGLYQKDVPKWITIKPAIRDTWSDCLQTFESHNHQVNSAAFSHDSTQLLSGSFDGTVKLWDIRNGECLQTFEGHSRSVKSVTFSDDSMLLASASSDATVKIWDARRGACLQTLTGHGDAVRSVSFLSSTQLASASYDKTVKIWDVNNGTCLQTLQRHSDKVNSVACNSMQVATGSDDKTVQIWDISSQKCLQTFEGHSKSVRSVAFSPNSRWLASASYDGTVKIWDIGSCECVQTLGGHGKSAESVAFSHNSAWLASASDHRVVKIWDVSSGECLQTLEGHGKSVESVAFSQDSTRLVSASADGTIKIWDISGLSSMSSGNAMQTQAHEGHSGWVSFVAFSPNATQLGSGSIDGTIKIWDASSGNCLQTLQAHDTWVNSVAFFPDLTRLGSASRDGTIKIWDLRTGECLQVFKTGEGWITEGAFHDNSTWLASRSEDRIIKIWDASNNKCVQTLEGHESWVSSVAFSYGLGLIASGSHDGTVKIWDASSGECLQTLSSDKRVYYISFDASGSCLYTGTDTIDISASLGSGAPTPVTESQGPHYRSAALGSDGKWIKCNTNLLWLPPEYRTTCHVTQGKAIGFGTWSGKVWICNFELDKLDDFTV